MSGVFQNGNVLTPVGKQQAAFPSFAQRNLIEAKL